jgi:hypothetical protein
MADIPLKSAPFGNIAPANLARGFLLMGQPATPTADGILISPRPSGAPEWLTFNEIAASGFTNADFTKAFVNIDPRIDPNAVLAPFNKKEAQDAIRRWLDAGDFGQMAYKALETSTPDMRHLWLREVVLPVFFQKYPGGRLACVTYADSVNGYLAFLNTLKKSQILNSSDPDILKEHAGKSAMSSFALNVPAEMIWLMLSFVSVVFFPDSFSFVASCEHLYFLIFVTDVPIRMSQGEDRYKPITRLMPTLLSVLDSRDTESVVALNAEFVRPIRQYPFNRRQYGPDNITALLRDYVARLNGFLPWLCDATNFVATDGQFDLDFAMQTYLTVYALLNTTYRIAIEQTDMFSRKMALFDVLELYAGLLDCRKTATQAAAWSAHLERSFISSLRATLHRYLTPFGDDFLAAVNDLLGDNFKVVEEGLIYGREVDGAVSVPKKGTIDFDKYTVILMRSLRNTKHGFKIGGEDYLSIHTGDISNDFPDYALALWLNFVTDQSPYTLKH